MSDFITNGELRIEVERLCDENERLKDECDRLRTARDTAVEDAKELVAQLCNMRAKNKKLYDLCEWLLNPYRLGAITGEGVSKQWCRETYDGGSHRLLESGIEVEK